MTELTQKQCDNPLAERTARVKSSSKAKTSRKAVFPQDKHTGRIRELEAEVVALRAAIAGAIRQLEATSDMLSERLSLIAEMENRRGAC